MTIPIDSNLEPPSAPSGVSAHVLTADEKSVSQGRLVLKRFLAHKPAVISLILFVLVKPTGLLGRKTIVKV